jgi:hypothetical protein
LTTPAPPPLRPAPVAPPPAAPSPPVEAKAAPAPAIVVINTNVDEARITLDGQVVADSVRNARLEVAAAGEHDLVVAADGKKPFKKRFTTTAGAILEIPVGLRSASSASGGGRPAKKKSDGFYMLDPLGTTQVR